MNTNITYSYTLEIHMYLSHVMRKPAAVVRWLDSIISILAEYNISRLQLVPVDEQAGSSLIWSETTIDRFFRDWAHLSLVT